MTRIYVTPGVGETEEECPGDHIRASLEKSLRVSGLEVFDLHVDALVADLGIEADQIQAIVARHRWERNFYAS